MTAHLFSFHVPRLTEADSTVEIDGGEHRHLARVLRVSPGAEVLATNGRGLLVAAVVETVGPGRTMARVTAVVERDPPRRRLALALALIPRAHFETAVAQCVEVGVTEFVPVAAAKCHARGWSSSSRARAERVAVAAMKQSGRSWLPGIGDAVTAAELGRIAKDFAHVVLADQHGDESLSPVRGDVLAIVGPEGGFTDEETAVLVGAGAVRATLSPHRLRSETAAVVVSASLARVV